MSEIYNPMIWLYYEEYKEYIRYYISLLCPKPFTIPDFPLLCNTKNFLRTWAEMQDINKGLPEK